MEFHSSPWLLDLGTPTFACCPDRYMKLLVRLREYVSKCHIKCIAIAILTVTGTDALRMYKMHIWP